jgi:hypothetical protein
MAIGQAPIQPMKLESKLSQIGATKWQYILAQWQCLGSIKTKMDLRPERAEYEYCPYRALVLFIHFNTQGVAIGLEYIWLTANAKQ